MDGYRPFVLTNKSLSFFVQPIMSTTTSRKKPAKRKASAPLPAGSSSASVAPALTKRLGPNPTLKQLEKMAKSMAAFTSAVDECRTLLAERVEEVDEHCASSLHSLDMSVAAKNAQINTLASDFEQKYNDARINTDQSIREFGLSQAQKIAEQYNKTVVDKSMLTQLQTRIQELESSLASQVEDSRATMGKTHAAQMAAQASRMELEAEKKAAQVDAQYQAAQGQIKILSEQLTHSQKEVAASRELVASVANARQSPAIQYAPAPRPADR